ncbi:hypothetical protein BS78_06G208400 [Paspalum vaginatum]|nr:hypothetical protein BS78_06G208400 [Paspalum vaginatum]
MTVMSGDGDAAVSGSSITTRATTGSHVLKINGYSAAKQVVTNGCYVSSCTFEVAGQTWCICYYPKGRRTQDANHIGLFLKLVRRSIKGTINARVRFILLPHHNLPEKKLPATPYCDSAASFKFELESTFHGFPRFVKREALEKSEYLLDDCFIIWCDVAVLEDPIVEANDMLRLGNGGACNRCTDVLCNCNCNAAKQQRRRQRGLTGAWFRLLGCLGRFCCS